MTKLFRRLALVLVGTVLLTIYGCGGGGGGGGSTATPTSISVTASLGRFNSGTQVTFTKPDGSELATGTVGDDGKATLTLSGYDGPVVVVVLGGINVKYFDERQRKFQDFVAGRRLRAVMPVPTSQVGVTALTNAAAVKLDAKVGGIASATAGTINDANAKVAAVFGLPDILVAPTPVDKDTGTTPSLTLSLAAPADKYALVLAALAKTATGSKSAADVADALAADLKDDKLDGLDGTTPVPTAILAYTPANLPAMYQEAASELLNAADKLLAPSLPLVIDTDVRNVRAVPNQSDVNLAKAMFGELRTTLNSFANDNKTGFLDTQAARINADLDANVSPEISKIADRISALELTTGVFEDGKAYSSPGNTLGFVPGINLQTGASALVRVTGSLNAVWNGFGSYDYCWTDSPTQLSNKVTCAHAGDDSADRANNRIKMLVFELTGTGTADQYTYTAKRYNMAVSVALNGLVTAGAFIDVSTPATTGSGTVGKTVSNGTTTAIMLNGTLPPSTDSTGLDTVAISAVRTSLVAAGNFRYALSGSVSTSKLADSSKLVTVSFDSGSFIDMDESASATTGSKIVAAKLVGTASAAASRFTGTLDLGSFMRDKFGSNHRATSGVFIGSISDTSLGGAGEILTGKLEGAVTGYNQYTSLLPKSASNFLHATLTFTGTVQPPSRPLLTLVLAVAQTGPTTASVALNYSYGTQSITGSGTVDSASPGSETLTLSNQDGIQVVTSTGAVTRAGATVATISNGTINYIDGVTESLN